MNQRKTIVALVVLGVAGLFAILWGINSLIYKNTAQTEEIVVDTKKQNLSGLTYSVNGENMTFKVGMNGFYRLEELTAYGDVDKDGDRDYVVLIKNTEDTKKPSYFLGVVQYSPEGLQPQKTLSIGSGFVPHSLIINPDGIITFQYKTNMQAKSVLYKEYSFDGSALSEHNSVIKSPSSK